VILVGAIFLVVLGVVPVQPWGVLLIGGAAVVEVAESMFWIWLSKRRKAAVGAEALIGRAAEVVRPCHPLGLVRLEGELWQARCEEGADRGEQVWVVALDGLTLRVEKDP
jgi:membrane protein implicated in regulation of membrane protease activity